MLDTNVLISAAVKPLGRQAQVVNLVAFRAVELFVSKAVLAEYREVFSRPKFARLPSAGVATLLALIESEATLVTPSTRLEVSTHDSDNRFYECADAARRDDNLSPTPLLPFKSGRKTLLHAPVAAVRREYGHTRDRWPSDWGYAIHVASL